MRKRVGWMMLGLVIAAFGAAWAYTQWSAEAAPARPAFSRAAVEAAIADPTRGADRDEDARRQPLALLTLAGVRQGDKVFELIPGTGYFTRMFSHVVGPAGHVYAVWPQQYAQYSVAKVDALKALARQPQFANLTVEVQPTPEIAAPEQVDLVFTSQNYHDYPDEFMGHMDPMTLVRAAWKMLKPGGAFIVIDHLAAPGSGMRDTEALHRIDPAIVRKQVESAGFRFDGESKVLLNRADKLDVKVFDPAVRGHTSKFAYRFVKPR